VVCGAIGELLDRRVLVGGPGGESDHVRHARPPRIYLIMGVHDRHPLWIMVLWIMKPMWIMIQDPMINTPMWIMIMGCGSWDRGAGGSAW
jgi:hypothetical protein